MGLYEVSLFVTLLGFGIETILANFHVWGIMFLLRTVLNILVRNASPRGPMCFRCLIFRLSRRCELLFLLCFIASWTWEKVSVMLYPCRFCVARQWICLFCVLRVWRCLWIIWWNNSQYVCVCLLFCCWMWWSCCVWLEVLYWIDHTRSSIEWVCCACGSSERLEYTSNIYKGVHLLQGFTVNFNLTCMYGW